MCTGCDPLLGDIAHIFPPIKSTPTLRFPLCSWLEPVILYPTYTSTISRFLLSIRSVLHRTKTFLSLGSVGGTWCENVRPKSERAKKVTTLARPKFQKLATTLISSSKMRLWNSTSLPPLQPANFLNNWLNLISHSVSAWKILKKGPCSTHFFCSFPHPADGVVIPPTVASLLFISLLFITDCRSRPSFSAVFFTIYLRLSLAVFLNNGLCSLFISPCLSVRLTTSRLSLLLLSIVNSQTGLRNVREHNSSPAREKALPLHPSSAKSCSGGVSVPTFLPRNYYSQFV